MKSIGAMITQLVALLDTRDLNAWENGFVRSVAERSNQGKNTLALTEHQLSKIEQLYTKHFGDA